jgi:hypothetical protein
MRGINFAISMGVAILLPMLITYGVNLIHPPPEYDDYHTVDYSVSEGLSNEDRAERTRIGKEESKRFLAAHVEYQKSLFFVALPAGILLVVVGAIMKVTAIGNGLVFGGVFTLIVGYYSYWSQLSDLLKFSSLLIALAFLVFTAYRIYSRLEPANNG